MNNKMRCEVLECQKLVNMEELEIQNGGFMCKQCREESMREWEEATRCGEQWFPKEMIG